MTEKEKKKLEEFLKELTDLTKKYGLEIGGCGCCGSPWIAGEKIGVDDLYYDRDKQKYKVPFVDFEE